MLVKIISDKNFPDHKWEIYKKSEDKYYIKFYEFYTSYGWRLICTDGGDTQGYFHSKASIEAEFNIKII